MDNSTIQALAGDALLVTQLELVTPTTVAGTFYGIAFTLFCLYVHALAPRLREGDITRQSRFMMAYSTVIMFCGLYFLILNAWLAQDAYIKHINYPGGPYLYELTAVRTTPVVLIGLICEMVIDISTAAIQVWRVWVVRSATRYANFVTVPPVMCLLTFMGLRLRTLVLEATVSPVKVILLDTRTAQVEFAIQGTITVFCTVLTSLYLIFKHWQQRKLMGKSHRSTGYVNIAAMLVESYALESIWVLTTVITSNHSGANFFMESVTYIEIIACLLVQYRVARGKAHGSHKEHENLSSLRWHHSNRVTTQFEETSETQDGLHVPTMPEATSVPRVSSIA